MKKYNVKMLHEANEDTEEDYANIVKPFLGNNNSNDNTTENIPIPTLPNFIALAMAKSQDTSPQQGTSQQQAKLQGTSQGTSQPQKGGLQRDIMVNARYKDTPEGNNADTTNDVAKLPNGYKQVSDISQLTDIFDKNTIDSLTKELENAPSTSLVNVNAKSSELSKDSVSSSASVYSNNKTAKVDRKLLAEYYSIGARDENTDVAKLGLKGTFDANYVTKNGINVVKFTSGKKILLLTPDIFNVLFKKDTK